MKELKIVQNQAGPDPHMLNVAMGPHYRLGKGIAQTYQRLCMALSPAILASFYYFGAASLRIFGLCLCFSILIDLIAETIAPSRDLTSNWSTISLALLLGFMLPVNAPWWLILIGCVLMIILGKKLFGGVGAYPVQPAVLSIAILQLSWPARMDYTESLKDLDWSVTMIEPLRLLKSMGAAAEDQYQLYELLLGQQVGATGSGMVLFIILGGLFLLLFKEIQWQAPVGFLAGVVLTAGIFHLFAPTVFASPLFYLLSGGILFTGVFLLTDQTTSPVNGLPLFLYGLLAGVLLILIQGYSKHVDGFVFAVLLVNICAPLLDMIKPKVKGAENV